MPLQSLIFDEVDLSDASVAESSTKNINNSFTVRAGGSPRGPLPALLVLCRVGGVLGAGSPWGGPTRGHGVCGVRGSLQVITPFRKLILCAENRKEMEDWIGALKSVQKWEIHEVGQPWARGAESPEVGSSGAGWGVKEGGPEGADGAGCAPQATQFNMEHFSGMHNWYACSHARPTFCNVCREALSGVTSHGLSCEGQHPGGGYGAMPVAVRLGTVLTLPPLPPKCASSRPTSAAPCAPPTTASGPRWPPSARKSSRTRTG